jgi:tRNA nucleotidyltransferase (CCA-adding enzyme)
MNIESKMIAHISFETYHLAKYEYTVSDPGSKNDGLKFYSEHRTRKSKAVYGKWGKTTSFYYIPSTPVGKEFKSLELLVESIGYAIKDNKIIKL